MHLKIPSAIESFAPRPRVVSTCGILLFELQLLRTQERALRITFNVRWINAIVDAVTGTAVCVCCRHHARWCGTLSCFWQRPTYVAGCLPFETFLLTWNLRGRGTSRSTLSEAWQLQLIAAISPELTDFKADQQLASTPQAKTIGTAHVQ